VKAFGLKTVAGPSDDAGGEAMRGNLDAIVEVGPLCPILEEAGLLDDAVEILFSGHDRGPDRGVEHDYEAAWWWRTPYAGSFFSPTR
jgi:hypothetical protein